MECNLSLTQTKLCIILFRRHVSQKYIISLNNSAIQILHSLARLPKTRRFQRNGRKYQMMESHLFIYLYEYIIPLIIYFRQLYNIYE